MNSLASLTEWIGTLRTSMGSGMPSYLSSRLLVGAGPAAAGPRQGREHRPAKARPGTTVRSRQKLPEKRADRDETLRARPGGAPDWVWGTRPPLAHSLKERR
ncbi:hypothetical protein GCM10011509_31490 [Ornithinimicrobium pekingense]|uniref:PH domain-containing protein n=1 Tax=Ornithinimicrobium pekingense TaxID=384677 RepID=A0ABQ2FE99_9MICO|nr:hypothetical protein GCM10011509_31490 [Ornithinimicrobium pekingense]